MLYVFGFGINLMLVLGWNSWFEYCKCVWESFFQGYKFFVKVIMIGILLFNFIFYLYVFCVVNQYFRKICWLIQWVCCEYCGKRWGCEYIVVIIVVFFLVILIFFWLFYWIGMFFLLLNILVIIVIFQILYVVIILNLVISFLLFVMWNWYFRDVLCKLLLFVFKVYCCSS